MPENTDEIIVNSEQQTDKKPKYTKKYIAKVVFAFIFALAANLLFFLLIWVSNRYDDVQFDQILYQIKSPVAGTSGGIVGSAMIEVVLVGTLVAAAEVFLYFFLSGRLKKWFGKFAFYAKLCKTKFCEFIKIHFMPITASMLVLSILVFILQLDIHIFIKNLFDESDFIEENYVNPDDVEISFPEQKRNLIYIYLESMEKTFSDTSAGGNITADFIPELSELANSNVSFEGEGGRGAYTYVGTRWTAAALFAQTSGVIIKVPLNFDVYGEDETYMPGITTLGDILSAEGYEQTILFGSDAGFAARDAYFTEHGNYNIIDIYSLIDDGKLPENYWEWWGFEDVKLFDFAKEELTRLASLDKPFNFTTLTADTHFPDGYKCPECEDVYEEQYSNVLACSSKQVYEFIEWIKAQDFYENTTIILSGDHLTMDPEFLADIDEGYVRTTYNCIINPADGVTEERALREFATFDMFPTTLAAMGACIEGDRLGLGTNLFADVDTLTERFGYDEVEEELSKKSEYYLDTFYDEKTREELEKASK